MLKLISPPLHDPRLQQIYKHTFYGQKKFIGNQTLLCADRKFTKLNSIYC